MGDDPPRDRTGILRRDGYPSRHLGPVQMTTDTALGVTKLCVQDGSKLPPPLRSLFSPSPREFPITDYDSWRTFIRTIGRD